MRRLLVAVLTVVTLGVASPAQAAWPSWLSEPDVRHGLRDICKAIRADEPYYISPIPHPQRACPYLFANWR